MSRILCCLLNTPKNQVGAGCVQQTKSHACVKIRLLPAPMFTLPAPCAAQGILPQGA